MGISITLYHLTEPTNVVNKTLDGTSAITLNAQLEPTGPINLVNPVFIVDTGVASTYNNLSSMNYLYAGAPLNRYYFITSLDFTVAKKAIIGCHVDVLMTFRSRINDTILNYTRGAGDINEMDDSSYPISDYMVQQYFNFTNWTDIFSNQGSGRQFLLRTVCSNPDTEPIVQLTDGQLFWSGDYGYDENNEPIYYCYQFKILGGKKANAIYMARDNITGMPQVLDKYYVESGGKAWQFHVDYSNRETVPYFTYVGTTT